MTQYAGELIRIKSILEDFDQETPLTNADVTSVHVEIFDREGTVVQASSAMVYDATDEFWYYLWDTTNLDSGTYRAKVLVLGTDGKYNWEIKRVRLANSPL